MEQRSLELELKCLLASVVFALYLLMLTVDNDEKKKQGELQYVRLRVVSTGALGNAINTGVFFFLPDPSRRPPQLGFRNLVL